MTERIEIDPRVCGGQSVIMGTRISVSTILEQLADGESWDSSLHGYPELVRADIRKTQSTPLVEVKTAGDGGFAAFEMTNALRQT